MPVQADFTLGAENFIRIDMGQLTQVVPMKRFQTPDIFFEHTLIVFVNGQRKQKDDDDGWIYIAPDMFEVKENYPNNFLISCLYVKKPY